MMAGAGCWLGGLRGCLVWTQSPIWEGGVQSRQHIACFSPRKLRPGKQEGDEGTEGRQGLAQGWGRLGRQGRPRAKGGAGVRAGTRGWV